MFVPGKQGGGQPPDLHVATGGIAGQYPFVGQAVAPAQVFIPGSQVTGQTRAEGPIKGQASPPGQVVPAWQRIGQFPETGQGAPPKQMLPLVHGVDAERSGQ